MGTDREMEISTSMRCLRTVVVLPSQTTDAEEPIEAFIGKREPNGTGR